MFLEGLGRVDIVNRQCSNQTFASIHFVMYHRISVIRYGYEKILAELLSYNMTA